jgi:hypothetical protein
MSWGRDAQRKAEDWTEIYYALDFKLNHSPAVVGDGKWIAHLKDIIEKIGPDGKNMTTEATAQEEVS